MKLRTLFILDAIVSLLLAIGFLLGPATLLKFFGFTTGKTEVLLVQVLGAALAGFGASEAGSVQLSEVRKWDYEAGIVVLGTGGATVMQNGRRPPELVGWNVASAESVRRGRGFGACSRDD